MTTCSMKGLLSDSFAGEWGGGAGDLLTPVLRTANFNDDGSLDYDSPAYRCIAEKKVKTKRLRRGDIILEKSGGTPNRPVGIVAYYDSDDEALCSNFNHVLRFDEGSANPFYMFHQLRWLREKGAFAPYTRKTTGLQNLQMKAFVELELVVPPKDEQDRAATSIRAIGSSRNELKKLLENLDELVKSRFVEMFGELLESGGDDEAEQLSNVAEIVSGITKGRKITSGATLRNVPYMAVSNVKDGYIDWTRVKTIDVTEEEVARYRLVPYDVLMTEGGDPDMLGRGALLLDHPKDCIHQNHVFRVRITDERLRPEYFEYYLQSPRAKQYFFSCAKRTTGIATINKRQISGLPVVMPPVSRQEAFISFVRQVDKLKFETQQAIDKLQMLYDSLAQEYFGS